MSQAKPVWVIKIGGAILDKQGALQQFLMSLKHVQSENHVSIVLVHGGGSTVDQMLSAANFKTEKLDGLRVTPIEQMPIIAGALAGSVNKTIVAASNSLEMNAVGLSLTDGQMITCKQANPKLGQVGIPSAGDKTVLTSLFASNLLPVVASIGSLNNGQLVNVNADDAAVALCQLLDAQLVLLTDVSGVKDKEGELLPTLSQAQADELINDGVIYGGMTAKVKAALTAAAHLRRSIAVASWDKPEQLIQMISGQSTGTRILPN